VTLVVVAIGAWVHNGRMIGLLSAKLARLEFDINDALHSEFVAQEVMTWHASRQERGLLLAWHSVREHSRHIIE